MQDNSATITEKRIAELEKRLKEKSCELEIQASLEKVRGIALAMKRPNDMPDVCRAISQQLESLGVKEIRNVQTAIIYAEKGTYMNYEFYAKHDKAFVTEVNYTDHAIARSFADQMLKGNGEIFITHMKGKEVKNWLNYQKGTNVFIDTWLETATSLNYYWYSLGPVALGISTYAPFDENEIELFKRFRNVFGLAYRRYLDIEKAEAQAREAQIQLALERVRARTMAMQKSSELSETAYVLFQQFKQLGEVPTQITIGIFNEQDRTIEFRITGANGTGDKIDQAFNLSIEEPTLLRKMYAAWKEQKKSIVIDLTGQELLNWIKYRTQMSGIADSGPEIDPAEHRFICAGFFSKGLLTFSSKESISEETTLILERFSAVFDQTYTRFLDLQKAEAQVREAQIQLALERVRAKTMAMQRPSEFVDVINVIGEQFIHLGFDFDWVNFSANGLDVSKAINIWNFVVVPGLYQEATRLVIPFFEHPVFKKAEDSVNEYHTSGNSFTVVLLDKKEKDSFLDHLFTNTIYKDLPEEAKTSQYNREAYQASNVVLKDTWLSVGKYDAKPLADEEIAILKRLANEFGQAYTRFLDLRKAEAQAREAQIEAALERVRSRTMAMHQTSELQEVIHKVHQELLNLQLSIDGGSFVVINKDIEKELKCWGSGGTADTSEEVVVPDFNMPFCTNLISGIKKGRGFFTEEFSQQEKKKYFTKLFEHVPWSNLSSEEKQKTLSSPGGYTRSVAVSNHTAIFIINHQGRKFTEAENDILRRFAKVFEQTYTRFLDLQKAEAQAREAQIETALERVRSRSMAMHKSDELLEVINVVSEQLQQLHIRFGFVTFGVTSQNEELDFWLASPGFPRPERIHMPAINNPITATVVEGQKQKLRFFSNLFSAEVTREWIQVLCDNNPASQIMIQSKDVIMNGPGFARSAVLLKNINVFIGNFAMKPLSDEQNAIVIRFANVFEQSYTRFLDLQKAEAQARESQIQLALERVRARTMAMHQSNELAETALLLFQQLQELGLSFSRTGFYIWRDDADLVEGWTSNGALDEILPSLLLPYKEDDGHRGIYEASLRREDSYEQVLAGKELDQHYQWLMSQPTAPVTLKNSKESGFIRLGKQYKYAAIFKQGYLLVISAEPQNNANNLLNRFAKVFEQTYTRFLDLQKAEAQAREAQIEAGLERVRSRAMAMQTSEELAPLIGTVFTELTKLDLALTRCVIWIFDPETNGATWWMANSEDAQNPISCHLPYNAFEPYLVFLEQWKKRANKFQYELSGTIKKDWDDYLFSKTGLSRLPTVVIEGMKAPERVFLTASFNNFGGLNAATLAPLSDQDLDILLRFAKVFDLTYTRFNDLKQAEAQAREAEIELALERVRARTMAMQHSEELQEVVHTVLERLKELNVEFYTAIIILFTEGSKDIIWWLENREKQQYSKILIPYADIKYLRDLFYVRENGINHFSKSYFSNEKNELYHHLFEHTDFKYVPEKQKKFLLEAESATFSVAIAKNSGIHLTRYSEKAFSENDNDILKRFANVFEQSYRRFLDLKKAEAQAREAQIEASLERVRGKAMAMHNSNDVSAAASMVFTELRKLGIDPIRCGVGLLNKESRQALLYSATSTSNEDSLSLIGWVILSGHPVLENIYGTWLKQEDYYPELTGEQLESYYKNLLAGLSLPTVPNWQSGEKQYGHFFSFSVGCLYAWSDRHYNESEIKILKRFATIIDLTFRRFLDLQKAEAQAREAQIETGLEKVRSRTLAMQKSDELADTSAVLFKQLIHLGIAPNRLYIGIIHDNSGEIEFWITDEDGSKVSSKFTGNALNNPSIKKMYDGWVEQKKWLVIDMHGKELREYFHYLGDELLVPFKGGLSQKRRIQYLTYFSKGFIGMASPDEQPNETVNLLERFAYVFNLTFTRFNDLQIAEAHALQAEQDLIEIKAARKRAEDTLTELQETQKQLIQSEKMASLGELTAGIAHEIQNPLNFVNNFSEVSNELVDEMNEELDKGEIQEARLIAIDIKQNLEKINHHGKRADAIVKGMLQHSRKSSGQKEPTDINALADEYLRLSYHGLRAKDKNFNATIETDFDNSIGKINIIPQDIGRVLLNLFNNAFYAVNEQKARNFDSYKPTVSVSTKKFDNRITIAVSDNGNGIPQQIIDKIFQPFFTTKPTGEGTGLGLSLSYDIIKAHGGEIKVETKEDEGTEFIIQLPA